MSNNMEDRNDIIKKADVNEITEGGLAGSIRRTYDSWFRVVSLSPPPRVEIT